MPPQLLRKLCLRPTYSLRTHLWVSFGSIATVAIVVIVVTSISVAFVAGRLVEDHAESTLNQQVTSSLQISSAYIAERFSTQLGSLSGSLGIISEAVRDRIVGDDWESDNEVPFKDMQTGLMRYPLASVPLPPDWNFTSNVNEDNYEEHLQYERRSWYGESYSVSTATAAFRFQGQCNPQASAGDMDYYPNCTVQNNDVTTCGVVHPVASKLHEKVGVLQYFMKPLYESLSEVRLFGVYFVNEGAGASVVFPTTVIDGRASYTSIGCEWMLNNTNPYTNQPFGTQDQVARCHGDGEEVFGREYNALERGWCRDQALQGGKTALYGPYLDAFGNGWILSMGNAVFDRITGEFLACTVADILLEYLAKRVDEISPDFIAQTSLIRWEDGALIHRPGLNLTVTPGASFFDSSNYDKKSYDEKKALIMEAYHSQQPPPTTEVYNAQLTTEFPIPSLPFEYDKDYMPQLLLVMAVSEDVFAVVDDIESAINKDVWGLVAISIALGIIGLGTVLLVTRFVSIRLTEPLEWMERTTSHIINSSKAIDAEQKPLLRWTPDTEITTLVAEFRTMIQGFSGNSPAKTAQSPTLEVKNLFEYRREIDACSQFAIAAQSSRLVATEEQSLPLSPGDCGPRETFTSEMDVDCPIMKDTPLSQRKGFRSSFRWSTTEVAGETESSSSSEANKKRRTPRKEMRILPPNDEVMGLERINFGSNLKGLESETKKQVDFQIEQSPIRRSPLFWWIVVLIVIPLLLTISAICTTVSWKVLKTLPDLQKSVEEESTRISKTNVAIITVERAKYTSSVISEVVRDLHMHKRFSEWLFSGVIERSDSITEMIAGGTEECKTQPNDLTSCPFFEDNTRTPCDCDWRDTYNMPCEEYEVDSRYLQESYWMVQRNDADPDTGARNSVSYPLLDQSAANTSWWTNVTELPGSNKGNLADGYETSYDRVRVVSAMAVATYPLVNYVQHFTDRVRTLGMFTGFESDGMLTGACGCVYSHGVASHFQSNDDNLAYQINDTLCPKGKFGYDSRCRSWYANGKAAGRTYMTAPYVFAGSGGIALSVTAPIIDSITGRHIGQSLNDFVPKDLISRLSRTSVGTVGAGFTVLITPAKDFTGGDTLIGPDYKFNTTTAIEDVVLPNDSAISLSRKAFEAIVEMMQSGGNDTVYFNRTTKEGGSEVLLFSFAPVKVPNLDTVNGSDFTHGSISGSIMAYSLGFAVNREALRGALDRECIGKELLMLTYALAGVAACTLLIIAIVTAMISIVLAQPVRILCGIVRSINEGEFQDDIPPIDGGSREVNQVYTVFSKLYKIIRFSNTAYFSGNMAGALKFSLDALTLFRNVDDKKAVGVAQNNLGNTFLSIYLSRKVDNTACVVVNNTCVCSAARACYDEAVELAEAEYETAVVDENLTDEEKEEYASLLANRYFNRGIFILMTSEDPCADVNSDELASGDLQKSAELDIDVRDHWIRSRSIKQKSELYFNRLIRRASGLVFAMKYGDEEMSLDVEALLHEADSLLCSVGKDSASPLLSGLSRIGRLQQLEEVAIHNHLKCGKLEEAAVFAIRMLREDEFINEFAFAASAEVLLQLLKRKEATDPLRLTEDAAITTKRSFRRMLKACKGPVRIPSLDKNVIFCVCLQNTSILETQEGLLLLHDEVCRDKDNIGLIVFDMESQEVGFELGPKTKENRAKLTELASLDPQSLTQGLTRNALDMVPTTTGQDTWVVLVTDCTTWNKGLQATNQTCLELSQQVPLHLSVIGVDLNENMATKLRSICRQRRGRLVETASDDRAVAEAFSDVATDWNGSVKLQGMTMESF